jgi:hypothetical protein
MISLTSNFFLVKEVTWVLTEKRSKVSTFPCELYSVIHFQKDNCSTKKNCSYAQKVALPIAAPGVEL